MSAGPTLAEVIQVLATECGPTLRHEDVAEEAATMIRAMFAVLPRRIERSVGLEGDVNA